MQGSSIGRTSVASRTSLPGGAATPAPKAAFSSGACSPKATSPLGGPGKTPFAGKGCSPPSKAPPGGKGKAAPPGKAPARLPAKALSCVPGRTNSASSPVFRGREQEDQTEGAKGPKLRPLFWTTTRQLDPQSVWNKVGEPVPFDRAVLEKQFLLTAPRGTVPGVPGTPLGRSGSGDIGQASLELRKRVRVLDDRTSRLLEIAFRKLPPPLQLSTIVDRLDNFPDCLPAEAVLALHGAIIEQQEAVDQIRQLSVAEGDLMQLDVPERYLWVLGIVPFCSAKLACGALLVSTAGELPDLRRSGEKVSSCCQALRNSTLLRKCLSTSLAVGNLLNRGTSRACAQGVVLPESMLKLDELRGVSEAEDVSEARGPTVLDFVTQALVDEASGGAQGAQAAACLERLREETERLLSKVRGAQSVPLEEAELSCRKVCAQAQRAQQGLSEVTEKTVGCCRMVERVRKICEEASLALTLVTQAKEEQALTLVWSSAKDAKVKSSDWFALWGQFLDQLLRAFGRARLPQPPQPPPGRPPPMLPGMPRSPPQSTPLKPEARGSTVALRAPVDPCDCVTPVCRKPESTTQEPTQPSVSPRSIARRLEAIQKDDDVLSDVSEWESARPEATAPAAGQLKAPPGQGASVPSPLHSPCPTPPTPKQQLLFTPPMTPVQAPPPRPAARPPLLQLQSPKQQPAEDLPTKRRQNVAVASVLQRRRLGSGGG